MAFGSLWAHPGEIKQSQITLNSAREQKLLLWDLFSRISMKRARKSRYLFGLSQALTEPVEAPPFHRTNPERYLLVLFGLLRWTGGVHGFSQRLTEPKRCAVKTIKIEKLTIQ